MINADKIQELKTSTNLLKVFESYGIKVIQKGKSHLAKCPFHKETKPSLSINEKAKLWQCFGCGEAGDVFQFIQKNEQCSFPEAVKKLAGIQNINSTDLKIIPKNIESVKRKSGTATADKINNQELMNRVMGFYHRIFKEQEKPKLYLKKRGINKEAIYEEYKLGYSDGTLLNSIPKDNEIIDQLKEMGILLDNGTSTTLSNHKERFLNCLVFPILDNEGNCVSFYGRNILPGARGSHFYLPGQRHGIFNLKRLKEKHPSTIIITESIIDAFSFIEKEIKNVLAIYGTNGFTPEHLALLKELKPAEIILALDADTEGQKGAKRIINTLRAVPGFSFNCKIITFQNSQDANEYFSKNSKSDFYALLGKSKKKPKQDTNICIKYFQVKHLEKKGARLNVTIKADIPDSNKFILDTFNLYSERDRIKLIDKAAELLSFNRDEIQDDFLNWIPIIEKKVQSDIGTEAQSENVIQLNPEEEKEALEFLKSPNLLDQIVKDYEDAGYIGEEINKKIAYLVMTSRKMKNPLSLVIMSNSAAGKSSLQKATLEFCPESEAKHFTRLTQQSLYYLGEDSLKHRFLSIEEEEGSSEASYSLKVLLSAKSLNVVSTSQDPATGKRKADEYVTHGPVAVMVSTTSPELEAELASRTLIISIDESKNQTSLIHQSQRMARTFAGKELAFKKEKAMRRHRNLQLLLDNDISVINNFAHKLTFPSDRLRYRRGNEQYLDLIDIIAFLRQFQKVLRTGEHIGKFVEVDLEDIRLANEIFTQIMGFSIDELAPATRQLLIVIVEYCAVKENLIFTRREIREQIKWGNTHLHNHLKKLIELDYVVSLNGSNGTLNHYKLVYEGNGKSDEKFIFGLKNPGDLA
ncbi:CHC2 zinc finger domain-containing protein [Candidatus Margulisiibacteriota bacterium]